MKLEPAAQRKTWLKLVPKIQTDPGNTKVLVIVLTLKPSNLKLWKNLLFTKRPNLINWDRLRVWISGGNLSHLKEEPRPSRRLKGQTHGDSVDLVSVNLVSLMKYNTPAHLLFSMTPPPDSHVCRSGPLSTVDPDQDPDEIRGPVWST